VDGAVDLIRLSECIRYLRVRRYRYHRNAHRQHGVALSIQVSLDQRDYAFTCQQDARRKEYCANKCPYVAGLRKPNATS
jgi:hypothetical protein